MEREPRLAGQLLVICSEQAVERDPAAALRDAQHASQLLLQDSPSAAPALLASAAALEALGRRSDALAALSAALEFGGAHMQECHFQMSLLDEQIQTDKKSGHAAKTEVQEGQGVVEGARPLGVGKQARSRAGKPCGPRRRQPDQVPAKAVASAEVTHKTGVGEIVSGLGAPVQEPVEVTTEVKTTAENEQRQSAAIADCEADMDMRAGRAVVDVGVERARARSATARVETAGNTGMMDSEAMGEVYAHGYADGGMDDAAKLRSPHGDLEVVDGDEQVKSGQLQMDFEAKDGMNAHVPVHTKAEGILQPVAAPRAEEGVQRMRRGQLHSKQASHGGIFFTCCREDWARTDDSESDTLIGVDP